MWATTAALSIRATILLLIRLFMVLSF